MAILGTIIKGFLDTREALVPEQDPLDQQEKQLMNLLSQAQYTQFGQYYGFTEILDSSDPAKAFAERVPYFDYNAINKQWWQKLHQGATDITWPGNPEYYALSSGTTGKKSKRIPVTDAMIQAIRGTGIQQIYALSNFDLPADFFEKEILMLGSSTDLKERNGHKEGEISGISAHNIPDWFKGYYKPGDDIAQIEDWDARVAAIVEQAPDWDIGALSGIPPWIELMLEKVIEHHNLAHIHEIWPNLQVYTSGGVAFGPYKKTFERLMGKPITIIDTYLASEGFLAFQARPETTAMRLATNNGIYFEFVPFDPEYIREDGSLVPGAPAVSLAEVEEDRDYVLLISTVSGAWRYTIGDTIRFTDKERAEIKITGRTKFFLNTVGSQLSVNKLDDGIHHLEQHFDKEIKEYTLCAKKFEDGYYHTWYLGMEDALEDTQLAQALDEYLKSANKNYKVARSKALKGVKVHVVPPEVFYEWNAKQKKKGGQVKMERVMGEEKFADWEAFVSQQA